MKLLIDYEGYCRKCDNLVAMRFPDGLVVPAPFPARERGGLAIWNDTKDEVEIVCRCGSVTLAPGEYVEVDVEDG